MDTFALLSTHNTGITGGTLLWFLLVVLVVLLIVYLVRRL